MSQVLVNGAGEPEPVVRSERRTINVSGWSGRGDWCPPVSHEAETRLRDRLAVHLVAVPELGAHPQRLGLGAAVLAYGTRIIAGWLVVGDGANPAAHRAGLRRIRKWAARHPISTRLGPRTWQVVDVATFNREVVYRHGYHGHCLIVGADLLCTFGLLAEVWHKPRNGEFADGFSFGLAGCGRLGRRNRWVTDYSKPPIYMTTRGAHSISAAFGYPRPYLNGKSGERERRGQWVKTANGKDRSYRGDWWELLGLGHTFDGIDSDDPADHHEAFAITAVAPHAVRCNAAGAADVVDTLHAQLALAVALDREAADWCDGLACSRISSGGTLAAQIVARMGVPAPLTHAGPDDGECDAWCRTRHGGWVASTPTTAPVPANDADVHACYPVLAHARGWWDFMTAERLQLDHPRDDLRAYAATIAAAAAAHDFTTVKALLFDVPTLRQWGCTRVVVRADRPPFPPLPVELHEDSAHGRLVIRPVMTVDGALWDVALGDYLAAVVTASAAEHMPCLFDVVDVVRVLPKGKIDGLTPVRVLGETIDPNVDDPAVVLVRMRTRLKNHAADRQERINGLDPDDPKRLALEHAARRDVRRAADLRVDVNAITYGNLARHDGDAKPGPWSAPWLAATITADAHLLLATVKADIETRGGVVLAIDTDGILAAVSPTGDEPVTTLDGRQYRTLSHAEHDEVLGGLDHLALDDRGLWEVHREHEGSPLWARAFGPKRYAIGRFLNGEFVVDRIVYADDADPGFEVVTNTEHSLAYVPPPTMPDRHADRRHHWAGDTARVHATYAAGRPFPRFGWEHGPGIAWPTLQRTQLATATSFFAIHSAVGLRPGAHVVEATPLAYRGTHRPRPLAADPGDDLRAWQDLAWFDGHDGQPIAEVLTDRDDLGRAVIFDRLSNTAFAWGKPRDLDIPDVIIIDAALMRRVGRRGVAMIEHNTTSVLDDIDTTALIVRAANDLGPTRFAELAGISFDDARDLTRRAPRSSKIARILHRFARTGHPGDPRAIAQLIDAADAVQGRCALDGCTLAAEPGHRYCTPEHAGQGRRARDRERKRRTRAQENEGT